MTITVDNNTKQAYYDTGVVIPYSSTIAANATANLPPGSILYGETVAAGDKIYYKKPCARDGGGSGTIELTYDGISTVTGTYGTYIADFKINNGALTTGVVAHADDAAIEAKFTAWMPARDAEGWSIEPEPETGATLIYVDPIGGDNGSATTYTPATLPGGTWDDPIGTINAYETIAAAHAQLTDGQGDYLLLKAGETHDLTAENMGGANVSLTLGAGKSNTYPQVISSYGANRKTDRPVVVAHPNTGNGDIFRASTGDSYNHIYNIDFHSQYRDPDHARFVGFGFSEFKDTAVWFYGASGPSLEGMLVENCRFRYTKLHTGSGTNTVNCIVRRNVFWGMYSSIQNIDNFFANGCSLLTEDNLFYKGGWYIPRDQNNYAGNTSNWHDGGVDDTTFNSDTLHANYSAWQTGTYDLDDCSVKNIATGEHGKVIAGNTANTFQAYLYYNDEYEQFGTSTGTVLMTFNHGEKVTCYTARQKGQSFDQSHNMYHPKPHESIYRNNNILLGAGMGLKSTANQTTFGDDYTGTHDGLDGATTFSDAGQSYPDLTGAVVTNTSTSPNRYSVIHTNDATSFQAYWTREQEDELFSTGRLTTGTVDATFDTGDVIEIDTGPFETKGNDLVYYDNYNYGNMVDYSGDLNRDFLDQGYRCLNYRFLNNVASANHVQGQNGTNSTGTFMQIAWHDGIYVGNNISTKNAGNMNNGSQVTGINLNRQHTNAIISRNILFDGGIPSGTGANVSRGSLVIRPVYAYVTGNIQILYNDVQNVNTDAVIYGGFESVANADTTFLGNRYYSLKDTEEWFEVDDVRVNEASWVSATGETGYTTTAITYNQELTHELYMASLGWTAPDQTILKFAEECEAMMNPGSWDTDYEARYVNAAFRLAYTEV